MAINDKTNETVIYVTKYATTKGILAFEPGSGTLSEFEDEPLKNQSFFRDRPPESRSITNFYREKDFTPDLETAQARVKAAVLKKIVSLTKQIKKLEKMPVSIMEVKRHEEI